MSLFGSGATGKGKYRCERGPEAFGPAKLQLLSQLLPKVDVWSRDMNEGAELSG